MQVLKTFYIGKLTRRLAEFQLEIAAEARINRARMYKPEKLAEIRSHLDSPAYPWESPYENKIFWRVYREIFPERRTDAKSGHASYR